MTRLAALAATTCALSACATLPSVQTLEDERRGTPAQWKAHLSSADDAHVARAVRAIGRIRDPALATLLLPAVVRTPEEAAFAFGQLDAPESIVTLMPLLSHADPAVRARAAEAVGKQGGDATVDGLFNLLTDPDPQVRGAAALALARVRGRRAKPDKPLPEQQGAALLAALRKLFDDADPGVRWKAVYALSEIDLPGRLPALRIASGFDDPVIRLFAVRGMTRAGGDESDFQLLVTDTDPHVADAAKAALTKDEPAKPDGAGPTREQALTGLAADDVKSRDESIAALAKLGKPEDLAAIEHAFDASAGDAYAEPRATAVRAAAEHYEEAAIPLLRRALADPAPAVVDAAGQALHELTGEPAPPPLVPGRRSSFEPWRGPPLRPQATLHTAKGDVVIELVGDEAPRHVAMFVSFAESGRYDGLTFHRVVPGFVVQGLDPRGDGWGTGGVFLRDEINPVPYDAGAVGMPNAGPDSGGCQLFITHVPTPHLDGRYTVFGRVVKGMEVVHNLAVGDVVERVDVSRPAP